jgi:glutamate/aspartate transport system ATP-binding protein
MIEIEKVSKWYGSFRVLTDCSTSLAKGEVVVVCGPSGSGKSTLIKCVNGLEPFEEGTITVEGVSLGDRKTDLPKLRARIGMVFQSFELYPHMTASENISLAQIKVLKRSKADATARARELLDRVGMVEHADKYPGNLFDEPTSALDPEMINEVLDVMVGLAQDGMTMIVVTHEMGFASNVADRIVFMDEGRIVEDTPKDEFFRAPRSERAKLFLSKILRH